MAAKRYRQLTLQEAQHENADDIPAFFGQSSIGPVAQVEEEDEEDEDDDDDFFFFPRRTNAK